MDFVSTPTAPHLASALLQRLLQATPDALLVVNERGDIVFINEQGEALFGYGHGELVGRAYQVLLPERFRAAHDEHHHRYLHDPRARPMGVGLELFARHKKGHDIPVEISLSPCSTEEAFFVLLAIRDVSERRHREHELRRRLHQQSILEALGLYALRTRDPTSLMERVAHSTCEALDVTHCRILELSPDGTTLLLKAGCGWREGYVGQILLGVGKSSLAGYTLEQAKPVVVEDLRTETRFHVPSFLRDHGVRSSLSVVVHGDGKPYGVLGVDATRPRQFSSHDVTTLQAIANLLSQALLRWEAEAALQRLNSELEQRVAARSKALRESEERFAKAFHLGPTPTIIVDLSDTRVLNVNESFLKLLGFTRHDLVQHTLFELNLLVETEKRRPILAALRAGRSVPTTEIRLRTKDGFLKTVLVTAEPVQFDEKPCALATYLDITERKRTEEELVQAIHAALNDASWFSQAVMEKLEQVRTGAAREEDVTPLTPREREVVACVAKGWDNKRIAKELRLSPQTVHNHLSRIYGKVGVGSRSELVVWARQHGFAAPD